jgi:hypothetical protein
MTSALEQNFQPTFAAIDEMETAFHCEPQVCEDSLQFLCMRWTTGSPECRGQARCELQAAAE